MTSSDGTDRHLITGPPRASIAFAVKVHYIFAQRPVFIEARSVTMPMRSGHESNRGIATGRQLHDRRPVAIARADVAMSGPLESEGQCAANDRRAIGAIHPTGVEPDRGSSVTGRVAASSRIGSAPPNALQAPHGVIYGQVAVPQPRKTVDAVLAVLAPSQDPESGWKLTQKRQLQVRITSSPVRSSHWIVATIVTQ